MRFAARPDVLDLGRSAALVCALALLLVTVALQTSLSASRSILATDPTAEPAGARLAKNTPTAVMPAPVLIGPGTADEVLPYRITKSWVADRCATGHPLDFRSYPDDTRMGVLGPDCPFTGELLSWTGDRFAGRPATPTW